MEDCPIGILIDLSEPKEDPPQFFSGSSQEEDKENVHPLTDSIEIERSADTERRLSLTLKSSDDIQNRILQDVTEKSLLNSAKKCQSPGLRLLDDETFDFDLAVSPCIRAEDVSRDEEDEVFFGPVCFTERLKQTVVEKEEVPPLSPLNPEQFALMVKEANYVAYRIKKSKSSPGSDASTSGVSTKPSCSSTDSDASPTLRKHSRSDTFTKCKSPLELLPEEIRKVLPVIDNSDKKLDIENDCQKKLFKEENKTSEIKNEKNSEKTVQSKLKAPTTRLRRPSNIQGSKLTKPSGIKYASSCESLDSKTSGHESDSNCSIASDTSDVPSKSNLPNSKLPGKTAASKMSRLQAPGSKLNRSLNASMNNSIHGTMNGSSAKVSVNTRLAIPKNGVETSNKGMTPKFGMQPKHHDNSASATKLDLSKTGERKQNKSVERQTRSSPRLKAKQDADNDNKGPVKAMTSGLKGPITKLSLIKPGEVQKRVNKPVTVNGPMKAIQPVETVTSAVENKTTSINRKMPACVSTPVKQDKCVKPKLLANNFSTPGRSSSVSSVGSTSTPVSNKRRSFLPTPNKSVSSIPESPLVKRIGSSTSSYQSRMSSCSSVSDSPVFNNSIKKIGSASTQKNCGQSFNVNEKSPEGFKSSKPKVVHTPQLPQKVQSKWSPIRRPHPVSKDEEVSKCTKRRL